MDTQILLWGSTNPDKINKKVMSIVNNKNSQIYISIVSLWEFSIKYSKGKLKFEGGISRLCEIIKLCGFTILPITQPHLAAFIELPLMENHKDPFDRLLVATAKAENMTILTADENIHKYDVQYIW
ncbi:MAG: type II toxin-antitoxin system VapC family toxin [Oscillospiraceae bacterium]|nr:type II toxin-antitoxin system VapC family toxin [Oscillospiraceae bacterium]